MTESANSHCKSVNLKWGPVEIAIWPLRILSLWRRNLTNIKKAKLANLTILAKHEIFHIWFLMGLSSTLRKTFYESLKLAELLKDVFLSNLPFTEQRYFSHQSKVILLKIYLFFFFCLSFFCVSFCINFDVCIIDLQCDVHIVQRINNSLSETTKSNLLCGYAFSPQASSSVSWYFLCG